MTISANQMMYVLKFTAEELEQNRDGLMSAAQKRRVVRGGLVVFVGVFLLAVLLGTGLTVTWDKPVPSRIYVGLGVFVGAMTLFGLWFYLLSPSSATQVSRCTYRLS